jgi:hypothetical protein
MSGVRELGNSQGNPLALPRADSAPARGESLYAIPGTYTWVCPAGVTSVSVVCVGGGGGGRSNSRGGSGGGLGYLNNISVTPGTSYSVTVGVAGLGGSKDVATAFTAQSGGDSFFIDALTVLGGGGQVDSTNSTGGTFVGGGGGNGGNGTNQGGAGAGGYAGAGGNTGASGAGGGGGGGGDSNGAGGGGVGLFGQGTSGGGGSGSSGGGGGSGGQAGINAYTFSGTNRSGDGGQFGGGGGAGGFIGNGQGGHGAVRIVWPGAVRQFPSTDVGTP